MLSWGASPARLASRMNVLDSRSTGTASRLEVLDGQIVIVEDALPKPGDLVVLWLRDVEQPVVKVLSKEIIGFPHHPRSEVVCGVYVEQIEPAQKVRVLGR